MNRRTLLGAVTGALPSLAGCLGSITGGGTDDGDDAVGDAPVMVRAMPAEGDETGATCRLSKEFVANHPPLEQALSAASDNAVGDWARVGVEVETGRSIATTLESRCGIDAGGIYLYDGGSFFVSVIATGTTPLPPGTDQEEHNHTH